MYNIHDDETDKLSNCCAFIEHRGSFLFLSGYSPLHSGIMLFDGKKIYYAEIREI